MRKGLYVVYRTRRMGNCRQGEESPKKDMCRGTDAAIGLGYGGLSGLVGLSDVLYGHVLTWHLSCGGVSLLRIAIIAGGRGYFLRVPDQCASDDSRLFKFVVHIPHIRWSTRLVIGDKD